MNRKTVLIVGGYGTVGRQIAQILHDRHPELKILLGGRSPEKALPFESVRVQTIAIDNSADDPLHIAGDNVSLVINSVNDLQDRLLLSAVKRKIPLIDLTRWTELFQHSIAKLEKTELHSPVVLSSGWMAGTASLFAMLYSTSLQNVVVNINALYSLKDKAGPDSTAYMDRMTIPFHIMEPKGKRMVLPMTDPEKVQFANGYTTKCYRLDTPDHVTLLKPNNIDSASFRISFDSKAATSMLVGMVKSGIWKMISGERFRSLRQSLLYNPGTGSAHHILIHLKGRDQNGKWTEQRISITDPLGQTHLTALGAAIQAEKILTIKEDKPMTPGIYFPEDLADERMDKTAIIDFFEQYGVLISH